MYFWIKNLNIDNLENKSLFNHPTISTEEQNEVIIDSILDIKGEKIIKIDLTELDDSPADFFIICQGESTTQVQSISNHIYARLKDELGILANHLEGMEGSKWVLIDYFSTVVHVFYPETRDFYDLESLWGDAKITEIESSWG